jgi:hypothetical protein
MGPVQIPQFRFPYNVLSVLGVVTFLFIVSTINVTIFMVWLTWYLG